jgi:hypothetical protein
VPARRLPQYRFRRGTRAYHARARVLVRAPHRTIQPYLGFRNCLTSSRALAIAYASRSLLK